MNDELLTRVKQRAAVQATRTDNADTSVPHRFSPATKIELAQSEQALGFSLPPFLRKVYMSVGNGGFGPGYGLIGLPGGFLDDGRSIVDLYRLYHVASPDGPTWEWPDRLVPICNWGCAIYSCVDCNTGAVLTFDPGEQPEGEPIDLAFAESHNSVAAWFEDWSKGISLWDKMYERLPSDESVVRNPFTGEKVTFSKLRLRR